MKGQMLRKEAEAVTWALERAEPESGNFLVIWGFCFCPGSHSLFVTFSSCPTSQQFNNMLNRYSLSYHGYILASQDPSPPYTVY